MAVVARRAKASEDAFAVDPVQFGQYLQKVDGALQGLEEMRRQRETDRQEQAEMKSDVGEIKGAVGQMNTTMQQLAASFTTLNSAVLAQAEARGEYKQAAKLVRWAKSNWKPLILAVLSFGTTVAALVPETRWPGWTGLPGMVTGLLAVTRLITGANGGGGPHA